MKRVHGFPVGELTTTTRTTKDLPQPSTTTAGRMSPPRVVAVPTPQQIPQIPTQLAQLSDVIAQQQRLFSLARGGASALSVEDLTMLQQLRSPMNTQLLHPG
uniref:CSTF_C domain-containing protein n=1 Tax=Heterorhabditis bacteriophora TaxID=37862 RepID=A0A1I7X8N0_HETBA